MKELYHICLTAHSEVLLRNLEDVRIFTNLSAYAAHRHDCDILVDSDMSTHLHQMTMCQEPSIYVRCLSMSLTKAFNCHHGRQGPLFDSNPHILKVKGPRHIQMAMNYSLRQGLHHGLSETPFDYPWSTCNYLFREERGTRYVAPAFQGRSEIRQLICKNAIVPEEWEADENGILLRPSFEQLAMVENWYGTARTYMYSMIRKTSEEWLTEQEKDKTDEAIITLSSLEKGYSQKEVDTMLSREGNSKFSNRAFSDMELCCIIDNNMLGRFGKRSVYDLSFIQKEKIAQELRFDLGIKSEEQISRCLVMKYR